MRFVAAFALVAFVAASCRERPASQQEPAAEPTAAVRLSPLAAEVPRLRDTIAALRASGELRVLLTNDDAEALPRISAEANADREGAREIARELGVRLRYVVVPEEVDPYRALVAGLGDLVLPQTGARRVAPPVGVRFSTAVRYDDEVVVVAKTALAPPRSMADLTGRTVHLSNASPFRGHLAEAAPDLVVATVPASFDRLDVLERVGSGSFAATVAFRDDVEQYLAFADDVAIAFSVRADLPVAWAAREQAGALVEAVNGNIYREALTRHRGDRYAADLAEIKRRRVLRVGMLNNSVSYFIYRGQEAGFQYELASLVAARLAVRLEVVIPDRPADMTQLLLDGRVDLIPVALSGLEDNNRIRHTVPLSLAEHLLVQPAGEPPITSVEQLVGREVHVRASSVYAPRIIELAAQVEGLEVVVAPEELETEDLIAMVGRGEIPLTVANSILLAVERSFRADVQGSLAIATDQPLVYGVRRDAPQLLARVDALLKRDRERPAYRAIVDKYFHNPERMGEVRRELASESGRISPWDDLARKYGRRFNIDWRLILAQMYQESRFDPNARSWAGAIGLMQVMPRTGAELGLRDLRDPEENIHAGVKYLARLMAQVEADLPMRQRVRFALAGYNAGIGHVKDARILARRLGLDPNRWFGNVEKAMLLLEKPRYHRRARRGYCRGSEPVAYVSRIQSKYDGYVALVPAASEHSK
jgi:membrane-bound lytic murein transglycosylase F